VISVSQFAKIVTLEVISWIEALLAVSRADYVPSTRACACWGKRHLPNFEPAPSTARQYLRSYQLVCWRFGWKYQWHHRVGVPNGPPCRWDVDDDSIKPSRKGLVTSLLVEWTHKRRGILGSLTCCCPWSHPNPYCFAYAHRHRRHSGGVRVKLKRRSKAANTVSLVCQAW
jgi:hypothetical protein